MVGLSGPGPYAAEIALRLNHEINVALQDQKVKDSLLAMGVVIKGGSPDGFGAFLKSETDKWAGIIRVAKIKPD